jgi:hypothetical protein
MTRSLIVLTFILLSSPAFAQKYDWAKSVDGFLLYSSALDRQQNLVVVGSFEKGVTVGDKTYVPSGASDLLVIKFDPTGQVLWSFAAGGTSRERADAVAIDSALNITVVGESSAITAGLTVTIGPYTLAPQGNRAFIFRLDKEGAIKWLLSPNAVNSTSELGLKIIAADTAGCITYVGGFSTQAQFGAFTLTGSSSNKFIAKLSPAGEVLWAKTFSTNYACYPVEVTTDRHNNLYVGCELRANWTFDDSTFANHGEYDMLVVKLSPNGELLSGWQFGQEGREGIDGIGVDNADNIYVLANYWGSFCIGDQTFPSSTSQANRLLMRLDQYGEVRWAKTVATHTLYLGGVCVDRFGNTCVTFNYIDSINLMDRSLTAFGGWDMVIASYDDQGNRRWFLQPGGDKWENGFSLSVDPLGKVYVAGRFEEKTKFGPFALNISSGWAGFIVRISEPVIVTTSPTQLEYCPGDSIKIAFTTNLPHTLGNQFFAYLSDSTGKFDSLNLIGKINGRRDTTMTARIPRDSKPSERYRVRVSSTLPPQEGLDRGPYFTIHALPDVKIEARKSVDYCEGNKVPLAASGGVSYRWSTGDTTASVEIGTPGWHYVTAMNEYGCEARDSIKLTVHPYPIASVTASGPTSFCQGGQVTLTAKGGKTYAWSTGEKTPAITVKESGEYYVVVKGDGDCTDESEKIDVVVYPAPLKPAITKLGDSIYSSSSYGNEWFLAGGSMIDTTQSIKPTKSGKYYVRVTDSNGCKSQSEFFDVVVEQNGVKETRALMFDVMPNPTNGIITVSLSSDEPSVIQLVDILGAVVQQQTVRTARTELDLSSLASGTYYLRVSTPNAVATRRVIKR